MQKVPARWTKPPVLNDGEIHVWIAEHERVDSWAFLRGLLGSYLKADPSSLEFSTGKRGKPSLAGAHGKLRFNLSHSGSIFLYAIASQIDVGVDVELYKGRHNVLAVAGRAFGSDARKRLAQLDEQQRERELLELWTLLEARLKCLGVGLAAAADERDRAHTWSQPVDIGERGVAALAASRRPTRVSVWR